MRTFSCFTTDKQSAVPHLSFVFAASVSRAIELARRELMDLRDAVSLEICENGKLLWAEDVRRVAQ